MDKAVQRQQPTFWVHKALLIIFVKYKISITRKKKKTHLKEFGKRRVLLFELFDPLVYIDDGTTKYSVQLEY